MVKVSGHINIYLSAVSFFGVVCSKLVLLPDQPHLIQNVGEDMAVTCRGELKKEHLQWRKEPNTLIHYSFKKRISTQSLDSLGLALVMKNVELSDAGTYTCHDTLSIETISFHLIVHEPINFKDTPSPQNGTEGDEAFTVRCEASGTPTPVIKWYASNRTLEAPKYELVADGLVIRNVVPEDAGNYSCVAFQGNESVAISDIQVNIKYKPRWITNKIPSVVFKIKNEKQTAAVLSCKAKAFPAPVVRWFYNTQLLYEGEKIELSEFGDYSCQVSNNLGTISRNFTLKEGHRPGLPKNPKVYNITLNDISLDFQPPETNKFLNITGYFIELRDTLGRNRQNITLRSDPPVIIKDLQPSTTYHIRLKAKNALGYGDFTQELEVKTKNAQGTKKILPLFFIGSIVTFLL